MPQYLSPGVYVEEVDSGSRPIEGVGTAVAVGGHRIPRGWRGATRDLGQLRAVLAAVVGCVLVCGNLDHPVLAIPGMYARPKGTSATLLADASDRHGQCRCARAHSPHTALESVADAR